VLSPLLSVSMLHLALGASVLTVTGVLAWRWYHAIMRRSPDRPAAAVDPATEMQAEIAEPR
jgi:MFS transporter, DHA1 family, multidrug resistance protein